MYIGKQNKTHRYRKKISGGGKEEGERWKYDFQIYKLLDIKQVSNKFILYSTGYTEYLMITFKRV